MGTTGAPAFTGNTSGDCITDLYITNLYGCSPITIHDNLQHITSSGTGVSSIAWGTNTIASGDYSHAEGGYTTASGTASHAEGASSHAKAIGSHAEGSNTLASGNYSHAEGRLTKAIGDYSHAEGGYTTTSGNYCHAEGYYTTATTLSHTEGQFTLANAITSHAEGTNTTASGSYSHAEGTGSVASGTASHAEGFNTKAIGDYSHSEGFGTFASGRWSHAGGRTSTVSGDTSFIHSANSLVIAHRSVVLGGQNITGTTDDTVYVPNLNVGTVGGGASVNNLGIDAIGNVVTGTAGGGGIVTGLTTTGTSGPSTLVGGSLNVPEYAGGFVHYLGEEFGGGIIYHLYKDNLNVEHGLIVSTGETTATWQNSTGTVTGGISSWDGSGNTASMTISNAANYVNALTDGGFTDWYLPSIDELKLLLVNRFNANKSLDALSATELSLDLEYWSSTERDSFNAYLVRFFAGNSSDEIKTNTNSVRAVRSF